MALNWKTYNSIPRLYNYAEAKRWHDDVTPIRGDEHKTKPCARRDQKWFSIWMRGKDVHVGYGSGKVEERQSLVIYHSDGTITLEKRNRWSSASDHERRVRLLGTDFRTHQYDTWVRCAWFDGGKKRKGFLPLHCNGQQNWDAVPASSTFVRDKDGDLVFLNYTYPTTHKPNKVRLKEALEPFAPFVQFVEGIRKLQGGHRLEFNEDTRAEYFGWSEGTNYQGKHYPNSAPQLFWGSEAEVNREQFCRWAMSDDLGDRMKAAITMVHNSPDKAPAFLRDLLLRERPIELLTEEVHTEGKLVTDRYKRYLRG